MNQPGASPKGHEPSKDGRTSIRDESYPVQLAASHSRFRSALGWLQELLLLASLAAVCSSSFDIASCHTSHHLHDVVDMLRMSAVGICASIAIGLYLSIFHPSFCSSTRSSQPSASLASSSARVSPESSCSEVAAGPDDPAHHRAPTARVTVSSAINLAEASSDMPSLRDAPSSYSPAFVSQLRGQLLHVQHQLYDSFQLPHFNCVMLFACPSKRWRTLTTYLYCGSSCSRCKRASAPCRVGA
jgi:hypothetical protein